MLLSHVFARGRRRQKASKACTPPMQPDVFSIVTRAISCFLVDRLSTGLMRLHHALSRDEQVVVTMRGGIKSGSAHQPVLKDLKDEVLQLPIEIAHRVRSCGTALSW